MDPSFVPFVAISAVVIVTPGPDTGLSIRNILVGGRASGLSTALGFAARQALWASPTSAGVVSILVTSALRRSITGALVALGTRLAYVER